MTNTKTVLIIEDEPSLRHALADKCYNIGVSVLEAADGDAGLQLALLKHPDLILLDLLLPGRDGMSLLTELRKDPWGKDAAVIILSNVSNITSVAEGMAHQVFEYHIKSDVAIEKVLEGIQTHLGMEIAKK